MCVCVCVCNNVFINNKACACEEMGVRVLMYINVRVQNVRNEESFVILLE